MNQFKVFVRSFLKIYFNIISLHRSPKLSLQVIPAIIRVSISSLMYGICLAHVILLDFIKLVILYIYIYI